MNDRNVAIIPARGGSKRIPKKNVKLFFGKPIIEYSIEAALESGCFSEVMVSTDDPKIAKIATKAGASVPFLRSSTTSKDKTPVGDAVLEVLDEYLKSGKKFDNFCCLFAAAPFIRAEDIKKAMRTLLKSNNINSVFTVVKYNHPVQRSFRIKNDKLEMQWRENLFKQSQDMEPIYHDAGQFYCCRVKTFRKEQHFFSLKSKPLILPETQVQDIDTIDDWRVAEVKYKMLINNKKGKNDAVRQKNTNRTRDILGRWIRRQLRGQEPR